jgi:hypothetical protein
MERIIDSRHFDTVGELLDLLSTLDKDSLVLNTDTLTVIEATLSDGSTVIDVRFSKTETGLNEGSTL